MPSRGNWTVYCLLSPDDRPIYIGVTRDMTRRLREHKKWLGFKPAWFPLEVGYGDRREAEHRWIEHYRSQGTVLLNKTVGGNGCQALNAASRALVGSYHRGRSRSEETKRRIKAALTGNCPAWTPEGLERAKLSRFQPGHMGWASFTPEKRATCLANIRKPQSSTHRSAYRKAACDTYTTEQRAAMTAQANAANAAMSPERRSKIAKIASDAAAADPNQRQRSSDTIRNWWANMTPEYRAEYLARRTAAIRAAGARN
jgi:hypothetical protein